MEKSELKLDKQEHFIKIAETPTINSSYSNVDFDEKIRQLVMKIMHSNNVNNHKILYQNLKNITLKNKTINRKLYNIFINPLFGKENIVAATYDINKNKITFYENEDLMIGHELVHMASSFAREDRIYSGFCQVFNLSGRKFEIGRGLTEGYTSLEADRIFGTLDNAYFIEKDLAKKLEQIVGANKMQSYFYNANLMGFANELTKYDSLNNIIDVLIKIDRVLMTKNIEEKKQYTRELYLKLYEYNLIKRKKEHDKGLLSDSEYDRLTVDFSRYYLLDVMRFFEFQDIIKEEERTK